MYLGKFLQQTTKLTYSDVVIGWKFWWPILRYVKFADIDGNLDFLLVLKH